MKKQSQIAIVGAGPAGTSLAIRLAMNGFSPVLIERERFPRHKLCGEFISPECLAHFTDLGVSDSMLSAGGDHIFETRFYEPGGRNAGVPSSWFGSGFALSLSRAQMDLKLLERAKDLGVEVLEETNAVGLTNHPHGIHAIKVRNNKGKSSEIMADLIIDATGRARIISKLIEKDSGHFIQKPGMHRNALVGFKNHLQNVDIEKGRCEIYFFRGGYGGLSCIEDGLANHCFLIRSEIVREFNGDPDKLIEQVIFRNKRAFETMKNSTPVTKWLAVSVDSFGAKDLSPGPGILAVGDAAAFIDPFTGSGMLLALESAEILADCILRHKKSVAISAAYHRLHKQRFASRLRISSMLRGFAFKPFFAKSAISILGFNDLSRELLARATRQSLRFRENK